MVSVDNKDEFLNNLSRNEKHKKYVSADNTPGNNFDNLSELDMENSIAQNFEDVHLDIEEDKYEIEDEYNRLLLALGREEKVSVE